jgi:serine protease Do
MEKHMPTSVDEPRRASRRLLTVLGVLAAFAFAGAERGLGQYKEGGFKEVGLEFQRGNPLFMSAFREAAAGPSRSTVRVLCDGRETALGTIVAGDGWVLTKAHDLRGQVACRLRDSRIVDARVVGVHTGHDLAMLQIPLRGLPVVELKESKSLSVGNWIVCPGTSDEPVAVGIVSVATRTRTARYVNDDAGFLGVSVEDAEGKVRITQVVPDSAAAKAGIRVLDVIAAMQNRNVATTEDFHALMQDRREGDVISLSVRRDKESLPFQVTLGKRPRTSVSELQNNMGSELSSRRTGYTTILQHDAVVRPKDCGGPLVDLDGRMVGMNVCRAGRTETWAIPIEVIHPLLGDLMSGRLAPQNTLPVRLK